MLVLVSAVSFAARCLIMERSLAIYYSLVFLIIRKISVKINIIIIQPDDFTVDQRYIRLDCH